MNTAPAHTSSTWSLVKVPAIITLVVTIARLVGELVGGPDSMFGRDAGGPGAWIGIVWLAPLFGFLFGWHLAKSPRAPARRGVAFFWSIASLGVLIGGFVAMRQFVNPTGVDAAGWITGVGLGATIVAFKAWPSLAWTNLVYGLLARLPVIAITFPAVWLDWDVHYAKLAPSLTIPDTQGQLIVLVAAQLALWIPYTIAVGAITGCLASFLRTRGAE